jgi:hypothetical protein
MSISICTDSHVQPHLASITSMTVNIQIANANFCDEKTSLISLHYLSGFCGGKVMTAIWGVSI